MTRSAFEDLKDSDLTSSKAKRYVVERSVVVTAAAKTMKERQQEDRNA